MKKGLRYVLVREGSWYVFAGDKHLGLIERFSVGRSDSCWMFRPNGGDWDYNGSRRTLGQLKDSLRSRYCAAEEQKKVTDPR